MFNILAGNWECDLTSKMGSRDEFEKYVSSHFFQLHLIDKQIKDLEERYQSNNDY